MFNTGLFSSASPHWRTPEALYDELNREFIFTLDPCPLGGVDGLERSWAGERVFCNPPYGRRVGAWFEKRHEAILSVYLVPSRTDTAWWHDHVLKATQIRFIRGRLRFNGAKINAPFPSAIVIYENWANGRKD
ncbi:MAG: DNA N-6-adenine-methyltransferase [Nitrospirales bacterium]